MMKIYILIGLAILIATGIIIFTLEKNMTTNINDEVNNKETAKKCESANPHPFNLEGDPGISIEDVGRWVKAFAGETVDNVNYGLLYPSDFSIFEQDDGVNIFKLRPERQLESVECGGFLAQKDELKMTIQIITKNSDQFDSIVDQYNNAPETISTRPKLFKVKRNISGTCEVRDEFFWKHDKNTYVVFTIRPAGNTLEAQYDTIMRTFQINECVAD